MASLTGFEDQGDLRSDAVGKLREKKHRTRYRGADAAALGRNKDEWSWEEDTPINPKRREVLNKRGILKEVHNTWKSCRCGWCMDAKVSRRLPKNPRYAEEIALAYEEPERCCTLCEDQERALEGVIFSYDQPRGPTYGSQILSQALSQAIVRFESKELDNLVKAEYDVVQADDSNSSDDEFELV